MDKTAYNFVLKLINLTFDYLSLPLRKNLADLITAFFSNTSITLWDLSSHLSGESTVKHKHKRLIYFLDQLELDFRFWKSFILTVFCLPGLNLKQRKQLTLVIDATTLKEDYWMLVCSALFEGRTIPLYMKAWSHVNVRYDYWARVTEFVTDLSELMPNGLNYEIVADRGFYGPKLANLVSKIGWKYVIRVNGNVMIKTKDKPDFVQLDLFTDGWYEQVCFSKTNQSTENIAVKSALTKEGKLTRWYIKTNVDSYEKKIKAYESRFWIEETFKDLKSKLKWETYTEKIPKKDRLIKATTVSLLSYAIQMSFGSQIEFSESERKKSSILTQFKNAYQRITLKLTDIILKFTAMINTYVKRTKFRFAQDFG